MPQLRSQYRVAIIGAGPGGICTGIQLKKAGIEDFVILEKSEGIGGTWWHNSYPGAECDVQSHLYSFSFEIKRDWSRPYAGQAEILSYLNHCVEKYGLKPHIRLGNAVRSAHWDDARECWRLITAAGDEIEAKVVVSGLGMFNELAWPSIQGLDAFTGTVFHSARWNHDHDLNGRRVGVIGSAASAVQFVPEIAPQVEQLYLHQRTANWVVPKDNNPYTEEQLAGFRADPSLVMARREELYRAWNALITFSDPQALREMEAAGERNMAVVKDPVLRRKLMPTHPFGCKRPLFSNLYYPTFNRPNVELVTDSIECVTPNGVLTVDGKERRVDTIIVSTGFETTKYLSAIEVTGRNGLRLDEAWSDGAQAYIGITTAGFPNLFMLYGPNTNNGSILYMLECQVNYIVQQLKRMDDEALAWMDVRREVMDRYNDKLQRDIEGVDVWQAGCTTYYRAPSGRVVTQWPHTMVEFTELTAKPDPADYEVRALAAS